MNVLNIHMHRKDRFLGNSQDCVHETAEERLRKLHFGLMEDLFSLFQNVFLNLLSQQDGTESKRSCIVS